VSPATTTELREQLLNLSQAERDALLKEVQSPEELPRKRTPLDTSTATSELFVADLESGDRVQDDTFVGQTIWFKGFNGAKGPKGGVYLYGRCVVGLKGQSQNGMLKIASQKFSDLKAGGSAEAWVRFDGEDKDTLIGVMTGYRQPAPKK